MSGFWKNQEKHPKNTIFGQNGKKLAFLKLFFKGPRDLGKYKSSEWLLDKLAISWIFGFCKLCPKFWDL